MKEEWIEELRQKLADYEEPAPKVLWDEIEKAVAKKRLLDSAASHREERVRIVPMWVRKVAAAAAVLLVLAVIGYDALDHVKHTDRSHDLSQNHEPVPSMIQAETAKQDSPAENPLLAKVTQAVKQAFQSEPIEEFLPEAIAEDRESGGQAPDLHQNQAASPPDSLDQTPDHQEARNGQKQTDIYYPQTTIYPSDLHKSPALRNRLTAKVYLSNAMGNSGNFSSNSYTFERTLNDPVNPGQTGPQSDKGEKGDQGDNGDKGYQGEKQDYTNPQGDNPNDTDTPTTVTETVTTTQQTHHYQPIRYGLSFRYRLNERWAVETGLTYSLLTSDVTKEDAEKITQWKQRLNYIGIPLKVEYMLWDSRYFNLYASAGMVVEKMVKGSLENLETGIKEDLSIRPLQFSVNGAVGAEFNLSRQFSIYAEPGLGYYFDNGSSVSTFYQDKPLSFNLNVGLRFSFK